jgi:hypothetical protein
MWGLYFDSGTMEVFRREVVPHTDFDVALVARGFGQRSTKPRRKR